ncbi:uncharacterized protein LOC114728882 [Neltuma alba]|uniref:uncharacterized protein LOC114728882 n=1 Tax=Neltuma alba TaxID=207710 RepID=UPI0010A3970E|nr:uncharacterized protein LOC114728882 [Prosopis alba]
MKEMEMVYGYNKPKNGSKIKCSRVGPRIPLNSDTVLVVKIPDVQILRIMSRSLFLAMALVTLPFLGSVLKGLSSSPSDFSHSSVYPKFDTEPPSINGVLLNFLLNDLADEGLLRKDDKALVITPPNGFVDVIPFNNEVEVVLDSDLERKISIPNESYDFVFISASEDAEFVDRILKSDGIVALPLGTNPSNAFKEKPNYRVVYLRTYSSIIVVLKKTGPEPSSKRKLCQLETVSKKVVLNGLEDVFLEPPKKSLVKSNKYLKKIKYLPNLMGNSLDGYKRRVFIGVGLPQENKVTIEWFKKNYPKSQHFEIHSLEIKPKDQSVSQTDVSAWLTKNVEEENFVVMKAEAEVVEEMIKKRTICIADELFLECKNEWWKSGRRKNNHRAYWECLALYGRLRDEGVAVHQWWG